MASRKASREPPCRAVKVNSKMTNSEASTVPPTSEPSGGPALTPAEQLIHTTVLLKTATYEGETGKGTGFLFAFFRKADEVFPVIVTNNHVVAGAASGSFDFTMRRPDGSPDFGQKITVGPIPDFDKHWIRHSDPTVDLAIFPCGGILSHLEKERKPVFIKTFDRSVIPTHATTQLITPLEDILVIGYPDGMSDVKNNVPLLRKGITATPFYLDFDGKKEFLIDAAIFPGSSGSPVLLFNQGAYPSRDGGLVIGSRIFLLGIVYGVFTDLAAGEIRLVPAPTQMKPMAMSRIPNNIGACIKSSRILEFEPLLVSKGVKPPEGYKKDSERI
jgi:Trypsin-like peptidase domain